MKNSFKIIVGAILCYIIISTYSMAQWGTNVYIDGLIVSGPLNANGGIATTTLTTSSLTLPAPVMIPLTNSVVPDTVNASADSMNCVTVSDFSLPSEYITYNHVYGNGSPKKDRAIFLLPYKPQQTALDSAYIWLRGSLDDKPDSLLCHLRILRRVTATDSTVVADSLFVVSAANTWQRKACVLTAAFTTTAIHTVMIEVYAVSDKWMDFSSLYLK